jgi:hypothetical protein
MADKKISQLDLATSVRDTDLLVLVQGGATLQAPVSQIRNWAVDTLAAFKALTNRPEAVLVKGKTAAYDGWGGIFVWMVGSSTTADDAIVVQCTSGTSGRYKRLFSGPVDARWFGAVGDNTNNDTSALQAAIDYVGSTNPGGPELFIPSGTYKITSSLTLNSHYYKIRGSGQWQTIINYNGVAGGCFVSTTTGQWQPTITDLRIQGNSSSGPGILCTTAAAIWQGGFRNLSIAAGGPAIKCFAVFSFTLQNIYASSVNDHVFFMDVDISTTLDNLYADTCGPGKAGYRMAGLIHLENCNGLNGGAYWGVFGSRTAASDGFQSDFPNDDFPVIICDNCNAESFASGAGGTSASAIRVVNYYRGFEWRGGKFAGPATDYHSVIRLYAGGLGDVPVYLAPGWWIPGAGTRTADLYTEFAGVFVDVTGVISGNGTTTYRYNDADLDLPTVVRQPVISGGTTYDYLPRLKSDSINADYVLVDGGHVEVRGVDVDTTNAGFVGRLPSGGSAMAVFAGVGGNWYSGQNAGSGSNDDTWGLYSATFGGKIWQANPDGSFHVYNAFAHEGSTLGFFGATPASKPTVSGSKGSNAALGSLLTALAALGLITDSSS